MATEYLSDEAIAIVNYYGQYSSQWDRIVYARNVLSVAEYQAAIQSALSAMNNVQINQAVNGATLGYAMSESIPLPQESLIVSSANSNYQVPAYGNGSVNAMIPANFSYDTNTNQYKTNAGAYDINGNTVASVFDRVSLALKGITLGAKLGVKIDEALYNANPEWWDEHLPTINPQTWSTIAGENEDGQKFIQTLFGIKDDGMTAYVDEDVLAYYYQLLRDEGVWGAGDTTVTYDNPPSDLVRLANGLWSQPVKLMPTSFSWIGSRDESGDRFDFETSGNICFNVESDAGFPNFYSDGPFTVKRYRRDTLIQTINGSSSPSVSYGNIPTGTYYTYNHGYQTNANLVVPTNTCSNASVCGPEMMWVAKNGVQTTPSAIEGITEVDGATQYPPTNITGQTPEEILPQLKQQYPDLFNNPLYIDSMNPEYDPQDPSDPEYDPDLSRNKPLITKTYIPEPWPFWPQPNPQYPTPDIPRPISDPDPEPVTDPVPDGDPDSKVQVQVEIIVSAQPDILVNPNPLNDPDFQPQPNPEQTPPNEQTQPDTPTPPDTGTGIAPIPDVPEGNASSLWAVYNPSQSQLNDFGAWLWSSNFVDLLKKLFNDPMQAIIGVHKVFVTPPTNGSSNIKCGYLDSGVSAKKVSSQYTEINCGTVSIREFFGNVFDYDPYTKISCYLPFIGVVPLKTSEVMRSSVNIRYGVDVITGACIAMIEVTRDGCGGILYSYGGSCACHYPISSGSYSGIISGLLTAAVGVATSALTSNPLPAISGGISAIKSSHATVQHSGGFSGASGAMGPKKPYIIIERPQVKMTGSYPHMVGIPANATERVGNCTGLIKCKEVHLKVSGAYSAELDEIETLLKNGVLISD